MLKKFVSKAMLSLVMEKGAREKLERVRESKRKAAGPDQGQLLQKASPAKPGKGEKQKTAQQSDPDFLLDALSRLETALENGALDEAASSPPAPPLSPPPHGGGGTREMTAQRQQLIRQALEIQRAKSSVLNDLDPEDRLRLHLMAKKIMGSGGD